MENASKALIIAGAILLSILIIALGIYVFNMAKGATNTDQLDDLAITAFNNSFTNYQGMKSGSEVVALLDMMVSSTIKNEGNADKLPDLVHMMSNGATSAVQVGIDSTTATSTSVSAIENVRTQVVNSHQYYIDFVKDPATGYIKAVCVCYKKGQWSTAKTKANAVVVK